MTFATSGWSSTISTDFTSSPELTQRASAAKVAELRLIVPRQFPWSSPAIHAVSSETQKGWCRANREEMHLSIKRNACSNDHFYVD
jgi:hypothetical protein